MHTCTMLYLLLLHRIFTNHIATICSNSSEMVAQQGLMNPIFAYHTKGLTFLPSRGLYCSWLTARTNLRPDSGQLRSNLQPRYLYHLESRWRNSHVLVHHDPLLSHLHHGVDIPELANDIPFHSACGSGCPLWGHLCSSRPVGVSLQGLGNGTMLSGFCSHDGSFSAHRRCMGETCQQLMQL